MKMKKLISYFYSYVFWKVRSYQLKLEIESIQINRNAVFCGRNIVRRGVTIGRDVHIDKYSYVSGPNTTINSAFIGKFCSIAMGVKIGMDEHEYRIVSTHPFLYSKKFGSFVKQSNSLQKKHRPIIGNDVWIGANAIVCRGVEISDGAVVAAGAVVTKNVPAYAIVAGVPAKVIGKRFDDNTIEELISLRWFDWSDEKIKDEIDSFYDINKFLNSKH